MKRGSFVLYFILFLIFFPWVGFFTGIDNQPNFIVAYFLGFLVGVHKAPINKYHVLLLISNLVALVIAVGISPDRASVKFVLTYLYIYISIFFVYMYVQDLNGRLSFKIVASAYLLYVLVGIVQYFDPAFLAYLTTRSIEDAISLSSTGRGVRSLTPEPATLGKVLNILIVICCYILYTNDRVAARSKILGLLFLNLIFLAVISKSAYALAIGMSMFAVYSCLYYKRLTVLVLFVLFFIVPYALSIFEGSRMYFLFNSMLYDPEILLGQGAMKRVLNIPITINNFYYFGPWGALASVDVFNGEVWTPLGVLEYEGGSRNLGGYIEMLLQLGVFSFPILSFYLYLLYRIRINISEFKMACWFIICTLMLTLQDGSPAVVLTWFMVMILGRNRLTSSSRCGTT